MNDQIEINWPISDDVLYATSYSFISAFAIAASIAFFHGAEYIERNKLDDETQPEEMEFYSNWPEVKLTVSFSHLL